MNSSHSQFQSSSIIHQLLSSPPRSSFPPLLRLAAARRLLPLGLSLHQLSLSLGLSWDPHIASSLLDFYSKINNIPDARRVFDGMPLRNIVPWSAMIAAYSRSGDPANAFSMYGRMLTEGIRPNSVTLLGLLSGLLELHQLECIHASAIRYGIDSDLILANSMVNMYGRLERLDLARALFNSIGWRDVVTWNSMVLGYARSGEMRRCIELFGEMMVAGECPDHRTYGSLLSSIAGHGEALDGLGKCVHALVVTSGFQFDTQIATALVSFYLKFGGREQAFHVFDRALYRDVVLWTAMVSGLVQNAAADKGLVVFHEMIRSRMMPTTTTIASVFSACAQLDLFLVGSSVHGFVIRWRLSLDTAAKNSLITMYAKCGHLRRCLLVFESMDDKDLVSWNAVVSGYAQNGHLEEALSLFVRMRSAFQRPDVVTIVSLLQACASLGALMHGRMIHNFFIRHELEASISLDTSLVDMYSKCGDLMVARKCFDLMLEQDLVSWSAIIAGYGSHGMGEAALEMYSSFCRTGAAPNAVMFMSVLSACSHSGLVSEGLAVFESMQTLGIMPRMEHCACIVDLLCKAGRVEEAMEFIRTMPIKPSADVLGILLDACRANGHDNLAAAIAREIVALKPETAGSYVQLVHGYAAISQWDGVGKAWAHMKSLGLRKTPGWSFFQLNGIITTFFAHSASHPRYEEMVFLLKILRSEMNEIDEFK